MKAGASLRLTHCEHDSEGIITSTISPPISDWIYRACTIANSLLRDAILAVADIAITQVSRPLRHNMALSSPPCLLLLISGFLGLIIFTVAAYLVGTGRFNSAISRRVYPLLMISLVANFLNMLTYLIQGVLYFGYEESVVVWTCFYIGILSEYWFFTPYLCRVYHVKVSIHDKSRQGTFGRQLYFRQSLTYLLWGFLPIFLTVIALACFSPLQAFPYSFQESDSSGPRYRHAMWLFLYFLQCMVWLGSVYQLRHITTKFSISAELTLACVIFCASEMAQHPQFYEWVFLNVTLRNVVLMCISGVWPALRQKKEKDKAFVTPEVLSCFELVLLHKDALKVFLRFLHSGDTDLKDGENLLWLILAANELETTPSLSVAKAIFEDYVESSTLFPTEVVTQTREKLKHKGSEQSYSEVFQECRRVALRRLKMYHFSLFVQSVFYENYRRKVEKMNRVIGTFETSAREMQ